MSRPSSRDRGASAVELALVVPVLLAIAFGIIDFGIYFSDSLAVRHGVRDGARQGSVERFNSSGSCATLSCLAQTTKDGIESLAGTPEVRVEIEGGTWEAGRDLIVCGAVRPGGVTGFTPLPSAATSEVHIRIEQENISPSGSSAQTGTDPTGRSWSWC